MIGIFIDTIVPTPTHLKVGNATLNASNYYTNKCRITFVFGLQHMIIKHSNLITIAKDAYM